MWEHVVKWRKAMRINVLQFSRKVIRMCLSQPQSNLELYDMDTRKSYHCELKEREGKLEKFLAQGRYEFDADRRLKSDDKLNFFLRYPPATRLLVCVDNRSDLMRMGV
ncbi:hypothetical protein RYX36_028840 [Vicia faba]